MLKTTIERQVMAVVWRIVVPSQRASIDIVSQLLGKVCLMSGKVDVASASSIFADMMIFGCDFCIIRCLEETSESCRSAVKQRNIRESVAIVVVLFAIALNTEHEQSHIAVVGNYRCIESGVDVACPQATSCAARLRSCA